MEKENSKFLSKNDIKSIVKILSFLLVLAVILQAFSLGAYSKKNAATYKNAYTRAYSFLSEPENSIEVAAIGSSDLYSAFVPMQLFENCGYTSTVICRPHQTVLDSYSILKELLKTQSPKVLIIETDMLYENAPEFDANESKNEFVVKIRRKLNTLFSNLDSRRFDDIVESHFSIFTFHNKWKNIKFGKFNNPFKGEEFNTIDHGYNFNNSVKPAEINYDMAKTDISEPVPDDDIYYLNKMIKICNDRGIKVFLVEMPTQNSWTYARHNAVQEYADDNKLAFIDFNLMFDELGLDIEKDYRDGGDHLNYFGATKTTSYLSDYLNKNYGSVLTDRRNDESYSYWKDSNEEFKRKYKIEELLKKHNQLY